MSTSSRPPFPKSASSTYQAYPLKTQPSQQLEYPLQKQRAWRIPRKKLASFMIASLNCPKSASSTVTSLHVPKSASRTVPRLPLQNQQARHTKPTHCKISQHSGKFPLCAISRLNVTKPNRCKISQLNVTKPTPSRLTRSLSPKSQNLNPKPSIIEPLQ